MPTTPRKPTRTITANNSRRALGLVTPFNTNFRTL